MNDGALSMHSMPWWYSIAVCCSVARRRSTVRLHGITLTVNLSAAYARIKLPGEFFRLDNFTPATATSMTLHSTICNFLLCSVDEHIIAICASCDWRFRALREDNHAAGHKLKPYRPDTKNSA